MVDQVQAQADHGEVERNEEGVGEALDRLPGLLGVAVQVAGEDAGQHGTKDG
jgi:hypothetical protein